MSKPREFYANYMAMHDSKTEAYEWIPKSEHCDIRIYVEHSFYLELEAKLKKVRRLILLKIENDDNCECGGEESDGTPVTCYLHDALEKIGVTESDYETEEC